LSLLVAPCSGQAARFAIEAWHYSTSGIPAGAVVRYGVWEDGLFTGALVFTRSNSPHIFESYGLEMTQGAELARVALGYERRACTSQIVAAGVRLLRQDNPGLRLLVSFSDPVQGHYGGVYQAMNWLYTGMTQPEPVYLDTNTGRLYHRRTYWEHRHDRPWLVPIPMPGKYRYLLPLDRKMRRAVKPLALPYPKPELAPPRLPQ
jgi:hypothetical protein